MNTHRLFIENSREHAEKIIGDIVGKKALENKVSIIKNTGLRGVARLPPWFVKTGSRAATGQ